MIVEGFLEDPSVTEADIENFMKHAKVLEWLQPPGSSQSSERPGPFTRCSPSAPAHLGFSLRRARLPRGSAGASLLPQAALRCPWKKPFILLPACPCDPSCLLSLLLSPGGVEGEEAAAGPARGQEGGSDSEAGQPEEGEAVTAARPLEWPPWR